MSTTTNRLTGAAGALALALGTLALAPIPAAAGDTEAMIAAGKKISMDRKQGNCIACHHMEGGVAAGTIGPPLVAMKARFPDKEKLRAQIWDATVANPESPMPPFGSHQILSDKQIDQVLEFIWTL